MVIIWHEMVEKDHLMSILEGQLMAIEMKHKKISRFLFLGDREMDDDRDDRDCDNYDDDDEDDDEYYNRLTEEIMGYKYFLPMNEEPVFNNFPSSNYIDDFLEDELTLENERNESQNIANRAKNAMNKFVEKNIDKHVKVPVKKRKITLE